MDFPRHNIISYHIDHQLQTVTLWVMCRLVLFEIHASLADLDDSSSASEFTELLRQADDTETDLADEGEEELIDWIISPCVSHLDQVAVPVKSGATLQDFYLPSRYQLQLAVKDDKVYATYDSRRRQIQSPFFTCKLDEPIYRDMATFNAKDLTIETVNIPSYDLFSDVPSRVSTPNGHTKFFKGLRDKEEFDQQLMTARRIKDAGLQDELKISKLHGIVVAHESKSAIGLIFDYIPSTFGNLGRYSVKADHVAIDQWEQQVLKTVGILHEHDIIWGDVNPSNIMVDDHNDAWIVDFGGGFVEEYVSREKAGTKEGDLEGIRNVFEQMRRNITSR